MPNVTKFANAHTAITTGYTSPTNAYADDGTDATAAPAKNAQISAYYGFPAFTTTDIPDGSTINQVSVDMQWDVSATNSIATQAIQIFINTTGVGSEQTDASEPTTKQILTHNVSSGVSLTDLRTADLVRARLRSIRGNDNDAVTFRIDYVQITVVYTPPPLTMQDAAIAVTIDAPTLTQKHTLAVADIAIGVTTDSPVLVPGEESEPLDTLVEDFNDNSFDTAKWSRNNATQVVEQNQRLEISSQATAGYFYAESADPYNLTDSDGFVRVVNAGNQSLASLEVYAPQLVADTDNSLFWLISGGSLLAFKKVVGTPTQVGSGLTFSATTHKYLRIREASGTTYWEYSANGSDWTEHHSESTPITIVNLTVVLMAGTYSDEGSTTTVIFDEFNIAAQSIAVNDIAISVTEDEPVLSQSHMLTVADITVPTPFDNVDLTQKHTLAVQDSLVSTTADNVSLTQKHTLVVADVAVSVTLDEPDLTESQTLDVDDVAIAVSTDEPTLTQKHVLAVSDMLLSTSSDNAVLTQKHTLVTADVAIAITEDEPVLTQSQILVVQDIAISSIVDAVVLTQKHTLAVDDALVSVTEDNVGLTQKHTLVVNDLAISLALDEPTLSVAVTLAVADIAIGLSVDAVVLTQKHTIEVSDSLISTTVDNVTLTQKHILSLADIAIGVTEDNIQLLAAGTLEVQDVSIATSSDNVVLTQKHTIVPADLLLSVSEDNAVLAEKHNLVVADIAIGVTEDEPELIVAGSTLEMQDARSSVTIDNVVLTQRHMLAVNDMAIGLSEESVELLSDSLLTVQDMLLSASFEEPVLDETPLNLLLTVADLGILTAFDNIALTQKHFLDTDDLAFQVLIENARVRKHLTFIKTGLRSGNNYSGNVQSGNRTEGNLVEERRRFVLRGNSDTV